MARSTEALEFHPQRVYRPYQQGNILTLANPLLVPETMNGGEIGFDLNGKTRRLSITAFRNSITNFIEQPNVGMQGNEIIRKRENVGDGINEGFEADVQQRWGRWLGTISYLYADTRLTSGPLERAAGSRRASQSGYGATDLGVKRDECFPRVFEPIPTNLTTSRINLSTPVMHFCSLRARNICGGNCRRILT